jgi:hypothetical protein
MFDRRRDSGKYARPGAGAGTPGRLGHASGHTDRGDLPSDLKSSGKVRSRIVMHRRAGC